MMGQLLLRKSPVTFLSEIMRCWHAVPCVHTVIGQCEEGDTKERDMMRKMQRYTLSLCQLIYKSPAHTGEPGDFLCLFGSEVCFFVEFMVG